MKTFRDYLSEEVMPSALVADGSIDIEKDAVRDNINGLLAGSMTCSSVTPYNALMKVRKVLAYFGIQLPKRAYMEGKHGIEVWEVHQFGDRMGMNDQGEFIKSVPAKYYLFFHYHMFGSMFSVRAKIVDREELDKEIDMAEMMINEDKDPCWKGYEMIGMKKKGGRKVPNCVPVEEAKEEPVYTHEKGPLYGTVTDHGEGKFSTRRKVGMFWRTKSHKSKESAIAHLQNKKLKEEQIDEISKGLARRYRDKAHADYTYSAGKRSDDEFVSGPGKKMTDVSGKPKFKERTKEAQKADDKTIQKRLKGLGMAHKRLAKEETQIDEIKVSTAYSYAGKKMEKERKGLLPGDNNPTSKTELKNMRNAAERTDKDYYKKRGFKKIEEEQIDETNKENKSKKKKWEADKGTKHFKTMGYPAALNQLSKSDSATLRHVGRNSPFKEETISEKAPPGAKFERMVKHIKKGYSKDGLTAKEKSIAYATAWKAKKREESE